jgi:hypothetical protein
VGPVVHRRRTTPLPDTDGAIHVLCEVWTIRVI